MKDILIDALVDLYQNGPRSEIFGICYHVQQYIEDQFEHGSEDVDYDLDLTIGRLFKRWPESSGSVAYPVPGPKGQSPSNAFNTCIMWSGWYGAKRWALAEFMLRTLANDPA